MIFPHRNLKTILNSGFTLVELLVVISVVALLVSLTIISVDSSKKKSRDSRRLSDINEIRNALELFRAANKKFPATLADPGLAPVFIPAIPKDPLTRNNYLYSSMDNCQSFHLGATLEIATSQALNSDNDAAANNTNLCPGSASDFDGTDPLYDIKS